MALNFSRLGQKENVQKKYNNIWTSQVAAARRAQLKNGMDDFTNFSWRGIDAFENFGAFIINKNNLKFYTGATYSNQYTKPQFESSTGNLTGVSFNTPKIDFTIGAYWISEDEYRQLIYWLNPYEISALTFDFEPKYYYQVKLASVDTGTRYIVGIDKNYDYSVKTFSAFEDLLSYNNFKQVRIKIDEEASEIIRFNNIILQKGRVYHFILQQDIGSIIDKYTMNIIGIAIEKDYRYYTEFKVTFEVQGPSCAYHKMGYEFDITQRFIDNDYSHYQAEWKVNDNVLHQIGSSDLEMPFIWYIPLNLTQVLDLSNFSNLDTIQCHLVGSINYYSSKKVLFDITLNNLSFLQYNTTPSNNNLMLNLKYDSASGLVFLELGNSEHLILSRLTTVSTGKRIVDSIMSQKHYFNGTFDVPIFDLSNISLMLDLNFYEIAEDNTVLSISMIQDSQPLGTDNSWYIDMKGRTNLI